MKKEEFLKELESLLAGISEEERADAIAFYRSYFEDAGEENEPSILAELESPQKVAESILKDLDGEAKSSDADSVAGEANTAGESNTAGETNTAGEVNTAGETNTGYYNAVQNQGEPKKDDTWKTVLIVILAVLSSPIWLTVLAVLACALFTVFCIILSIAVAAVAIMGALIITGFVLGVTGIVLIPGGNVAAGIGLLGGGCLVLALGILAVLLCILICGAFLPWAVKGIIRLCRKPFDKRRERVA